MVLYLTSNPFSYGKFNPANDFVTQLSRDWRAGGGCLLMSADPQDFSNNDRIRDDFASALCEASLSFSSFDVCDYRSPELADRLENYSAVFLSGGHVPTQNKFFAEISLRKKIKNFNGVVLGVSAGSMNCADAVYAIPELEGEAISKKYKRYISGLSLTELMVIPHYYSALEAKVDGLRVIDDLALGDSLGKTFYGLPDGSYFVKRGALTTLFGEAYIITDGKIQMI